MLDERIYRYTNEMELNESFLGDVLVAFRSDFGFDPPLDYAEFLTYANGGEGTVGGDSYLVLWKVENLKSWNEGYGANEFVPGLLLVGSDGGDTAYALDTRQSLVQFCQVPFVGMNLSETTTIGLSFMEFLEFIRSD